MSDERPVVLKKLKRNSDSAESRKVCIVHDTAICSSSVAVGNLCSNSLERIREAVAIRQKQLNEVCRKSELCANIPTEFDSKLHGVHWECYRNFTNVSGLVANNAANFCDDTSDSFRRSVRNSIVSGSTVLFGKDKCIFCGTCRKRKCDSSYEKLSQCMTYDAEKAVKVTAQQSRDFRLLA